MSKTAEPVIGVIGGSGLYEMDGLGEVERLRVETPFGDVSDEIVIGVLGGRRVCFLPRHGAKHHLLPHEINHKANIWALRSLGVRWLLCVTAVGSLREEMEPRHLVVADQLIDRTGTAAKHTFFGNGIAAHVGFADPYCHDLRSILYQAARRHTDQVHAKGTYLCMNGPAFSTRAEARTHRERGADLIGMTNAPEARLAREAEMACAVLAMVTDYDCWKESEEPVDVDAVVANLHACGDLAQKVIRDAVGLISAVPESEPHRALDKAIFTPREAWPEETVSRLSPILGRFL
jgi:5'-methylthioadenosine phosphorylase